MSVVIPPERYMKLLEDFFSRHNNLKDRGKTVADIPSLPTREQRWWLQSTEELFTYLHLQGVSQRIFPERLQWVGGESLLYKARIGNHEDVQYFAVKVASERFNKVEFEEIEKPGLFKKPEKRALRNVWQDRFGEGIELQKAAHYQLQRDGFNVAGIQKVIYLAKTPPVFAVLEWIEGEEFDAYINRHFEDKKLLLFMFYKLLRLFEKVHEYNIVHRDVKPKNVLIDAYRKPILLDFSLLRNMMDIDPDRTVPGMLIGDPGYSPPEQVDPYESDPSKHDHRGDLYSMGWILYKICTGDHPPTHLHRKLLRDAARNKVPSAFQDIFYTATAKEREHRYQTAAQFLEHYTETCRQLGIFFDQELIHEKEFVAKQREIIEQQSTPQTPDILALRQAVLELNKKIDALQQCPIEEAGTCALLEAFKVQLAAFLEHEKTLDLSSVDVKFEKNQALNEKLFQLLVGLKFNNKRD